MKGSLGAILYAGVMAVVCAAVLTAARERLRPRQEDNAKAERYRNVLEVLGVPFDKDAPWKRLQTVYERSVTEEGAGDETVYRRQGPEGTVAVRLSGRGRNGPIKGFLALAADMRTIRGITFYRQDETPGLGGEISNKDWRKKFIGKRIADGDRIGIEITRPDQAGGDGQVDGITGATITCRKVERILNDRIAAIVKEAPDGE